MDREKLEMLIEKYERIRSHGIGVSEWTGWMKSAYAFLKELRKECGMDEA